MPAIKILYGQCLADVAVKQYANIAALFDLAKQNGLSLDAEPAAGMLIELPAIVLSKISVSGNAAIIPKPFVSALAYQCLVDLAMQEGGSVAALFEVAKLNGLGITSDLVAGSQYVKPTIIDKKIIKAFSGTHKPASSTLVPFTQYPEQFEGIDYWIIEDTFIVN